MPYSGASDESLPSYVKKLSPSKRAQWVEIFNSVMKEGGDESKAFAQANGVVVKKKKGYIGDIYSLDSRQVPKDAANYDPLGATDEKGCANCNFYVPEDDGCILVSGDIYPTGLCKFHFVAPPVEMQPIPVTVVDSKEDNLVAKITDAIKSLFNKSESAPPPVQPQAPISTPLPIWQFVKEADNTRFFVVYSNNFKDKEGEVLTEQAHKEYIEWATKTGNYPDLWLWHAGPKSKWGKVDFLDYVDGFAIASGLIDKDKEYIADNIKDQDLGVSHGFQGLITASKAIVRYRTLEVSPLPIWAAANEWTSAKIKELEAEMGFKDEKRKWLMETAKVPEATITEWEKSLETLSSSLKALGIDYKESEPDDLVAQIASLTGIVANFAQVVDGLKKSFDEAKKTDDEKLENFFKAKIAEMPKPAPASESPNNIVDEKQKQKDLDWFGEVVFGGTK